MVGEPIDEAAESSQKSGTYCQSRENEIRDSNLPALCAIHCPG